VSTVPLARRRTCEVDIHALKSAEVPLAGRPLCDDTWATQSDVRANRDPAWRARRSMRPKPLVDVEEVARAVADMAGLPLDATVATMTVPATKMPFVGCG
jgi:hypothetical protein